MPTLDLAQHPHRRYNPLNGEWILVSPHRAKRPWRGKEESLPPARRPSYDPTCYLCPGNERAGGMRNPVYGETFVFTNDFSALAQETPSEEWRTDDLTVARGEPGICRVICFSPRHDLTLAEMEVAEITRVVEIWKEEFQSLGRLPRVNHVQIFENKGELMGCSNGHPHGQIWAQESLPVEPAKEAEQQKNYRQLHGSCLLCDYLASEMARGERVVFQNERFVVLVPFWAIWPYETMILSRRHCGSLAEFEGRESAQLAAAVKDITVRYDNLFRTSFPYSSGLHQAPTDGSAHPEWHLHMHFYPPLLRSATVKKFMVGYEMLANPQRDITPEASAAHLKEQPSVHYLSM
jgi:UDPglucose--hexose-1-phosphate uridylyltransferase